MSARTRPLLVLLLLAGLAVPARAEEAAAAPEGWSPERFWFADVVPPAQAWQRIRTRVSQASRADVRALQKSLVETYLAVWKGDAPAGEDRLAFATMLRYAERPGDALTVLGGILADDDLDVQTRTDAALQMGSLVGLGRSLDGVDAESLGDRAQALASWVAKGEGGPSARASVLFALADHAAAADDLDEAVRWNMEAARTEPGRAAQAGRNLERLLMASELELDAYDPLRTKAAALFGELRALAAKNLEALGKSADEKTRARAEAVVRLLESAELPFTLLGRPAPAWTLDHALGEVDALEDLRGKVVVLDFWATWCGWCMKSFPALRDLRRDYEDQGLAIVGVTTTHRSVYDSRFDLDDDMRAKLEPGRPVRPAAVLAGGRAPGGDVPVLEGDAYRAKEREVLASFLAAHEIPWPVVMIDPDEPKSKYALLGWPHAVVLDRQGRVRFFKSGALLRDRPEQVAHFRAQLEKLLAEAAD